MGFDNTQTKAMDSSVKTVPSPHQQYTAAKPLDSSESIGLPSGNLSQ